jgi:tetratricopeptide (TPR) repeat protein
MAEVDLQLALRSLTDAELLYVRGIAPEATHQFKHALIRDAAYEALLRSRRKELHRIVARTIDEKFSAFKGTYPEVLARHWTEAGEIESAITEWQRAGESAIERRAYREAEQHYRQALSLLRTRSESSDRDTRELTLHVALGRVMEATRGWSAGDTAEVYERARMLAERAGVAESVQVLDGLWSTVNTWSELRASLSLADQMLKIASSLGRAPTLVTAHYAQGNTRYFLADLAGARDHFGQAMRHYRAEDFRGNPIDLGVRVLSWAAINEWYLGYPDTALKYSNDAIALARRQNNLFDLAWAVGQSVQVHNFRGEFKHALDACNEASSWVTHRDFRY